MRRTVAELEEACEFHAGATLALTEGDLRTGIRLAALAGDTALIDRTRALLIAAPTLARLAAFDLTHRGFPTIAGSIHAALGDVAEAAVLFLQGSDYANAAAQFERAHRPVDAAKALEKGLGIDETRDDLREALGMLLLRHGRLQPAAKILQQVSDVEIKRRTDPVVVRILRDLGLVVAAEELASTLEPAPVAPEEPPASVPPPSGNPTLGARRTRSNAKRTMFGRYEILAEIAQTPNAQVLEATDLVSHERVAIKLLVVQHRGGGRDAVLRFEREARVLTKLRHPNVVPLLEYFPEGPALVMPLLSSGSLADLLDREPIVPARAVEIAVAVLGALGEAHRVGILHRDIKPSNVLFDDVGAIRVSDFGAAHLSDGATTVTAGAIGTRAYMSPEQRQFKAATVQSDIFGVGVLLLEMIAGSLPADATITPTLSGAHQDLDSNHDQVLARFLADEPGDRPANVDEARSLLESRGWSDRQPNARRERTRAPLSAPPAAGRYRRDGFTHVAFDTLLGREVFVFELDDARLAIARAFASIRSASLAAVLSASAIDGTIVVEKPRGEPLATRGGALDPRALGQIRKALSTLHALGIAHGSVDGTHVYLDEVGFATLAFPTTVTVRSPSDDFQALQTLA